MTFRPRSRSKGTGRAEGPPGDPSAGIDRRLGAGGAIGYRFLESGFEYDEIDTILAATRVINF